VLLQKLYVADRSGMTLWPCTCVDDMHPLERRLRLTFWAWKQDNLPERAPAWVQGMVSAMREGSNGA